MQAQREPATTCTGLFDDLDAPEMVQKFGGRWPEGCVARALRTPFIDEWGDRKLQVGWGVHIIEGPNKPLIAWLATGILVSSFVVSLVYDIVLNNRESGFAIGQWMVAVLATILTAVYFHLADRV